MSDRKLDLNNEVVIQKEELNLLLDTLKNQGYQTVGPHIKHQVLQYGPIQSLADLPQGYISVQDNGRYRLEQGGHNRYFCITHGAQSWKQFIFPARKELFRLEKDNGHWERTNAEAEHPSYALIGVRPCDLSAINILDDVLIREDFYDPDYSARRSRLFILAADCLTPSGTCFCASMGTGPAAKTGFDLKLTELEDVFLIKIGSDIGLAIMNEIKWEPAGAFHQKAAQQGLEKAAQMMGRKVEAVDALPDVLLNQLDSPLWSEVGSRCMSCTSCTQVCPTCFCWDAVDNTDITGKNTSRDLVWDSCFNLAYSAQAGGNTRPTVRARYRQWLTHKFGYWKHQFGSLGCVGCGRCITWCPAEIDVTAEIRTFQEVATQ
jgi:formate hydrogenlyase subunit 6/NADH:ubiquinone oxidoreductase subunit I